MAFPLVPLVAALLACAPREGLRQETAPEVGAISGTVLARGNVPVCGAEVLLLDGATGAPIFFAAGSSATGGPVFSRGSAGGGSVLDDWCSATTDRDGRFAFAGVAPGRYRLVAQSWGEGELFEERGDERAKPGVLKPALAVDLRGVANDVKVAANGTATVEIGPLGDRVFVYDRGSSNDDWYLVLSLAPTSADPVLGFVGWRGAFTSKALGAIRMRKGQAIVRGLPSAHVHYAIFANDSGPCWGAGSLRGNLKRTTSHDTNLVGGWSDARKAPPEALAPLVELVRMAQEERGPMAVMERLLVGREAEWEAHRKKRGNRIERMFAAADLLGPLDRKVALEDGGTGYRVGDLLAAEAYVRLGRQR